MNKPNIIMIYVDDMGWRDLMCFGSTFYETPNIDKLASEGMRFSQAYSTSPVCSPARASLMTGKYPASIGITNWVNWFGREDEPDLAHRGKLMDVPYKHHLPHSEKTIAAALREGGYATWHVGKWHLGGEGSLPTDHGFDINIGGNHMGAPMSGYFSPYNIPYLDNGPEGEFLTDRLTDEAINLIRRNKETKNAPFYLNLWHYAVHTPIQGIKEDVEYFKQKAARLKLDQLNHMLEGENFPFEWQKHNRVERRMLQSDPTYAALIYNLDKNIGRLMQAIEQMELTKNTMIIFSSDNGGLSTAEGSPTCNLPLAEGKGWMYDGGVRVPLIVKWPGNISANTINDEVVTCADFYPTFLEAASLPLIPEQHYDGISLLPTLTGQGKLEREAVFWHYPHYANQGGTPGCAVRIGDYKLIEFFEDGNLELYNLKNDISECCDLSNDRQEIRDAMYKQLCDWKEQVNANIPANNPDWKPI